MGRRKKPLAAFIDTHVAVWLYAKTLGPLSRRALGVIEENPLFISPMAVLELEYLYEIGKIKVNSRTIIEFLSQALDLQVAEDGFDAIVSAAIQEKWTRDPFDRIIVAHARARNALLVSRDERIGKKYRKTVG